MTNATLFIIKQELYRAIQSIEREIELFPYADNVNELKNRRNQLNMAYMEVVGEITF